MRTLLYLLVPLLAVLRLTPPSPPVGRHVAADPLPTTVRVPWGRATPPVPAGRHARLPRRSPRARSYVPHPSPVLWSCPLCGRAFLVPTPDHDCPGDQPPLTFERSRLVHPAYEDWERRQGALARGDGLDDLRAELAPLVRRLTAVRPEVAL